MVRRSAAQRRASLANLAKARAKLRGKASKVSHATGKAHVSTAHAGDVTGAPGGVRYRKNRLRKPRIRL